MFAVLMTELTWSVVDLVFPVLPAVPPGIWQLDAPGGCCPVEFWLSITFLSA